MRLVPTPPFETTLQGAQQSSRVASGLFILKPLEQLAGGPPRFGLKPGMQLRRHRHERIWTTPTTLDLLLGLTGRAHLAIPPCRSQARQKCFQRRRGWCKPLARHRTIGDLHEPLLARPDRTQQLNGVQRGVNRRYPIERGCRRSRVRDETLMRRRRRVIPLRDLGTVTRFLGSVSV